MNLNLASIIVKETEQLFGVSAEVKKVKMNIPAYYPIRVNGRLYSRHQIAKGTGMSVSAVSKIFSGKRMPGLVKAIKIAQFMGVSVEFLMGNIVPKAIQAVRVE